MTSPVTTYVEPGAGPTCESTFTMAFLVPEQHQESPPVPLDKNIFIEDRPKLSILTRYCKYHECHSFFHGLLYCTLCTRL